MVHSMRLVTFTAKTEKKHDFCLESICDSQRAELHFEKSLVITRNNLTIYMEGIMRLVIGQLP
jgi:hypothetical protein